MDGMATNIGVDEFENYQDSGTVRTQFDKENTPPSMAVIASLAEIMDVDPVNLDPLYSTVEPDAVDALIRVRNGTSEDVQVSFTHEDHAITVSSYGVVTITPEYVDTVEKYDGDDV